MAEVKTKPVAALRTNDIDDHARPGAFEYYVNGREPQKIAGMLYACPCGCGNVGALDFKPAPSPSWQWDGNLDEPTLSPSVHHVGHWHGWLRKGVWESC